MSNPTPLRTEIEAIVYELESRLNDLIVKNKPSTGLDKMHTEAVDAIMSKVQTLIPKNLDGPIELGDYPESEIDLIEQDTLVVITYREGYNAAIAEMRQRAGLDT